MTATPNWSWLLLLAEGPRGGWEGASPRKLIDRQGQDGGSVCWTLSDPRELLTARAAIPFLPSLARFMLLYRRCGINAAHPKMTMYSYKSNFFFCSAGTVQRGCVSLEEQLAMIPSALKY